MPKRKQHDLHVRDLAFVIEEAIRRLPNGESRLAVSHLPLGYACLGEFDVPDISERLSSDYGVPSRNEEIEKQYYEEITTIGAIMEEADVPIRLADWQSKVECVEKMRGLNRRAYAIRMWHWYAIPWRFCNDSVHVIHCPRDLLGSPIIHSYPAADFLRALAEEMEKRHEESEKLERQLSIWRTFGIVVLILLGVISYEVIPGWIIAITVVLVLLGILFWGIIHRFISRFIA